MNNNGFKENFSYEEGKYKKSVEELSKFFAEHFQDGLLDEERQFTDDFEGKVEKEKFERLHSRLEELLIKATDRLGHKIDESKLIMDAYQHGLGLKELTTGLSDSFYSEVAGRLEKYKAENLKERLKELLQKYEDSVEFKAANDKLINDSHQILETGDSDKLPSSNVLENLCVGIEQRLKNAA